MPRYGLLKMAFALLIGERPAATTNRPAFMPVVPGCAARWIAS